MNRNSQRIYRVRNTHTPKAGSWVKEALDPQEEQDAESRGELGSILNEGDWEGPVSLDGEGRAGWEGIP